MFKKLSELKQGESGIIRSFDNEYLSIKLLEMGCIPGEKIVIEQIAPLKDPISILIGGYKLSLRVEEAENITVEQII